MDISATPTGHRRFAHRGDGPRIWLHVGLPKTATTALQTWLSKSADELRAKGLDPLSSLGLSPVEGHGQFFYRLFGWGNFEQDDPLLVLARRPERFAALLRDSACPDFVMSAEILSYVLASPCIRSTVERWLQELSSMGVTFYVFGCMRDPTIWLTAAYAEEVRGGCPDPYLDWLQSERGLASTRATDSIRLWEDLVSTDRCFWFAFREGGAASHWRIVLQALFGEIASPTAATVTWQTESIRVTLSGTALETMRQLNGLLQGPWNGYSIAPWREQVYSSLTHMTARRGTAVSSDENALATALSDAANIGWRGLETIRWRGGLTDFGVSPVTALEIAIARLTFDPAQVTQLVADHRHLVPNARPE